MDWGDGKGQVHGFFTQGLVASTNNNWYGSSSDHVSFDFREIGLNGSYRVTPGIQLSAQLISRRAGEMDDGELWLDYAFVDLTLLSSAENKAGVRLGRMKNPYGLYTDTRDVAFTRPGIIVPQPIYFDSLRKLALSGDGIHVYGNLAVPGGTLEAITGIISLPLDDRSNKASLVAPHAPGELDQNGLTTGIRVLYETNDKQWRGGFSYDPHKSVYHPGQGDPNPRRDMKFKPWILSLQYTNEYITLTGEYSQRKGKIVSGGITLLDSTSEDWYVQAQYRFMPQWEMLLRYDNITSDKDDPSGKQFAARTGLPSHGQYLHDWIVGLRYDVTPGFMLRTEWHHAKGTGGLSPLDNPVAADLERDWNMLMLLGSYHF